MLVEQVFNIRVGISRGVWAFGHLDPVRVQSSADVADTVFDACCASVLPTNILAVRAFCSSYKTLPRDLGL